MSALKGPPYNLDDLDDPNELDQLPAEDSDSGYVHVPAASHSNDDTEKADADEQSEDKPVWTTLPPGSRSKSLDGSPTRLMIEHVIAECDAVAIQNTEEQRRRRLT